MSRRQPRSLTNAIRVVWGLVLPGLSHVLPEIKTRARPANLPARRTNRRPESSAH